MITNVEFTDNRIAIKKEINKKGLDWVREVAAELESQVIKNSRTDTGDTKRYWKYYMDESQGFMGRIWNWRICGKW